MQAKHTENIRTVGKYHKTRIKTISYESCTRRREHRTIWRSLCGSGTSQKEFQDISSNPMKKSMMQEVT